MGIIAELLRLPGWKGAILDLMRYCWSVPVVLLMACTLSASLCRLSTSLPKLDSLKLDSLKLDLSSRSSTLFIRSQPEGPANPPLITNLPHHSNWIHSLS